MGQAILLLIAIVLYILACAIFKDDLKEQKPRRQTKQYKFNELAMQPFKSFSVDPSELRSDKEQN